MNTIETSSTRQDDDLALIGEFPCTQTQLRCWILDQLNPGNPALKRRRSLGDPRGLQGRECRGCLSQGHSAPRGLENKACRAGRQTMQQVVEQIDFKMAEIDLRKRGDGTAPEADPSIGEETAQAPFDLSKAGLFRASLLMVEK